MTGMLKALLAQVRGLRIAAWMAGLACLMAASGASAETLLMPKRDARMGVPVVVWGVHTQAAGTACSINFGDASPLQSCTGVDRSYVAFPHTYASQGVYTVTMTVGAEVATTQVSIFDPAALPGGATGDANRSLGINMAIQDGLRFLWTNQINRAANFPASTTTFWQNSSFPAADTSLVVLAFENQGYKITPNVAPTGLYEKYVVRRGLNYVITNTTTLALGLTPAGNNPCLVHADCVGVVPSNGADRGYTAALAILSLAGSSALTHVNTEVAGYTSGKTYGEILQRMVNALTWGQNDGGAGRGGWDYSFNSTTGDGSTVGWDILALLDASAAGATVPGWSIAEVGVLLGAGGILNSNGSFDYWADNNPATSTYAGPQKAGIGLQGLFLIGETSGARVTAVVNNINSWWNGAGGIGQNYWTSCSGGSSAANKSCAYSMFNNFKGLKLQGVVTLPNVARPAGPGAQPAGDWYADYQDWFVANQTSPNTTGGGTWGPAMGFSCCASGDAIETAIAELILAPVALVLPDPGTFAALGLQHGSPLTTDPQTNLITKPAGTHTVTGITVAGNGNPVPGTTVTFTVISGPNAGATGSGTTGANGQTTFTYTGTGGLGTDNIRATVGALESNILVKHWVAMVCDMDADGDIDTTDLLAIRGKFGQPAGGANAKYDANGDGAINVADMRYCQLRLTPP
jgi:hypothetical protein